MPHVLGGGSEEGMRMKMDRESLAVAAFRLTPDSVRRP